MALFIQKPIFWNTNHYRAPSGVKATSGYPQKYGYGHEEWNNSPRLLLTRNQRRFRVFHTERLRADLLAENAGQTFVFMTASHDRIQQLVGIAGNAIGMSGDEYKMQRYEIAKELSLGDLWKEAWAVPNVRQRWQADQPEFRKLWRQNLHWIPNWICPDEFFWWLDEPVTLDAKWRSRGKRRKLCCKCSVAIPGGTCQPSRVCSTRSGLSERRSGCCSPTRCSAPGRAVAGR